MNPAGDDHETMTTHEQPVQISPRRRWLRRSGACLWIGTIVAVTAMWSSRSPEDAAAQTAEGQNDETSKVLRLNLGANGEIRVNDLIQPGDATQPEKAEPVWDPNGVEDFTFTNCDGRTISKQDLLGKPWVAGFVFTHCVSTCPMITQKMRDLQERLKKEDLRLVTFGVDPDRDPPEVLLKYAETYRADLSKWYFLTGPATEIYGLIHRSFQMPCQMPDELTGNYQVIHSNYVILVDARGVVTGKYLGTNDDDMAALAREIRRQLRPPGPGRTVAAGVDGTPVIPVDAWYLRLPPINASLNALSAALLVLGLVLIRQRRITAHRNVMLSAFGVSAVFLVCYVVYHAALHHNLGLRGMPFRGTGPIRIIYFAILISHIVLAATVPVLAILTIYRGLKQDWARHRRIAKITFPIWMYVSVTGVIIYGMLYHWPTVGL